MSRSSVLSCVLAAAVLLPTQLARAQSSSSEGGSSSSAAASSSMQAESSSAAVMSSSAVAMPSSSAMAPPSSSLVPSSSSVMMPSSSASMMPPSSSVMMPSSSASMMPPSSSMMMPPSSSSSMMEMPDAGTCTPRCPSNRKQVIACVNNMPVTQTCGATEYCENAQCQVCVPGCAGTSRQRVCVDGVPFNRDCADDERCMNGQCTFIPPPDAGQGCMVGCLSDSLARRCVNGAPLDVECTAEQVCRNALCLDAVDAGGMMTDAGVVDSGCVEECLDEGRLQVCTSTGQSLVVGCGDGSPCQLGACVHPEPPKDDDGEGNCGCTGLGSLGLVSAVGLMLPRRRRRGQG